MRAVIYGFILGLVLLIPFCMIAPARAVIFISGGGGGAACSTPDNGDMFDEGFINAGFEEAKFSSTSNGSGSVDADYDISGLGSPPSDVCSEGAEIIAINGETYITYDHGSTIDSTVGTTIFAHIYVPSGAYSIDDATDTNILMIGTQSIPVNDDPAGLIKVVRSGANYNYWDKSNLMGAVVFDSWQTLELHVDSGTDASWSKLDGGSANNFTQQAGKNKRYVHIGGMHFISSTEKVQVYIGYAYANTTE